jgi:hypothetical protein
MKALRRIFFLCLILVVWVGFTQAAADKEVVPVIEVEGPNYEFPQVTQGDVVSHDFRVLNRGSAPLEIKSVKPG